MVPGDVRDGTLRPGYSVANGAVRVNPDGVILHLDAAANSLVRESAPDIILIFVTNQQFDAV